MPMTVGAPLFIAGVAMVLGILLGRFAARLWLAMTLLGAVAALVAAIMILGGRREWEWHSSFTMGGDLLHLRLDGISAFFLVLLSVVGGVTSVYAREYWSDAAHPRSAPVGRVWWSLMLLMLGLVLLAS